MNVTSLLAQFALCLTLATAGAATAERPNIILFIVDDVSWNDVGCYGNREARTPAIDRLAAHGRRFDEAYLTASSCSPSRSSIITGRYPHNNGRASELHQPISAHLPWFPRLLRESGYYTALVGKHHMTSDKPAPGEQPQPEPFDLVDKGNEPGNSGGHATWVQTVRQRPPDKPFFFWFASHDAHRDWDGDVQWRADAYGPKHSPQDLPLPPALADTLETRQDLASYYNEVSRFDHYVGLVVAELERQHVLTNTLVLVMADNGRPFPRAKTRLHDCGMKTPFIACWPAGIAQPGKATRGLISAIDIAPTCLALAGVKAPETLQGVSFAPLLADPDASVRRCAFSEHNWHDYEAHGRSVRSEGYLYIRNRRPQFAWQGPADSVASPSHQSLRAARDGGALTPAQADVFLAPRPVEELYLTAEDPEQLHNLADDPKCAPVKAGLASLLDAWAEATGDSAPAKLSADSFDRETGKHLKGVAKDSFRGTPAGSDRGADRINSPGPR